MTKATIELLFTEKEYKEYFIYELSNFGNIENLSIFQLFKIGKLIFPILYPNGVTDGSSIIGKTFEFLAKRAEERGLTIF